MTTEKNTWIQKGEQFFFCMDWTEDKSSQYCAYLKKWQSLFCPEMFEIERLEVKENGKAIAFSLFVKNISQFNPAIPLINTLSTFEKLAIFQKLIYVDDFLKKNELNLSWDISQLYLHPSGHAIWLPPTPFFLTKAVDSRESVINFFYTLFEIPIDNTIIDSQLKLSKALERKSLPREWSVFIDYYLHQADFEKITQFFSFIFYQSWLYISAHHLGMKGESLKLLSCDDYKKLSQLGTNLGLTQPQMQELDVMAHYSNLNTQKFINRFEAML